jgi:hypothetical protein
VAVEYPGGGIGNGAGEEAAGREISLRISRQKSYRIAQVDGTVGVGGGDTDIRGNNGIQAQIDAAKGSAAGIEPEAGVAELLEDAAGRKLRDEVSF